MIYERCTLMRALINLVTYFRVMVIGSHGNRINWPFNILSTVSSNSVVMETHAHRLWKDFRSQWHDDDARDLQRGMWGIWRFPIILGSDWSNIFTCSWSERDASSVCIGITHHNTNNAFKYLLRQWYHPDPHVVYCDDN